MKRGCKKYGAGGGGASFSIWQVSPGAVWCGGKRVGIGVEAEGRGRMGTDAHGGVEIAI
jgi:hypothetical protein